jgi:cytochrome c-type biogenesis protein CcmH/NrfG
MRILKVIVVFIFMVLLVACEGDKPTATKVPSIKKVVIQAETTPKEAVKSTAKLSKRAKVDLEIQRIEGLMKTKPTVKGWMLIGDAHMHFKRYKEAAGAYNDAYMLSERAAEPRKKLKNAMYYVGLEKASGAR